MGHDVVVFSSIPPVQYQVLVLMWELELINILAGVFKDSIEEKNKFKFKGWMRNQVLERQPGAGSMKEMACINIH